MSDQNTADPNRAPAAPPGMIRFRVSVPDRPDLPAKELLAPDELTAWAKYKIATVGSQNLPFKPKVERLA